MNTRIERLLYTIRDAEYLLSCSRTTLWRHIRRGDLVPTRLGRAVRFSPEAILRFVAARQEQA